MKRRLIIAMTAALAILLLAACGGGEEEAGPTVVAATTTPDTPTATARPASTVTTVPAATAVPAPTPTPPPQPTATSVPPTEAPTAVAEPTATPVATEAEFFLQLVDPVDLEVITEESPIAITGRTRVDAVITVNDTAVEPDGEGVFTSEVELEEGPNVVEIVSSVASGEQLDLVLVVIYTP